MAGRPAQHRRRAKHPAPSPLRKVGRLLSTADRQGHSARSRFRARSNPHALHLHAQDNAVAARRRVLAQPTFDDHGRLRSIMAPIDREAANPLLEQVAQRRMHRTLQRVVAEQPAGGEDGHHDAGELDARPAAEKGDRTARPAQCERERQRARGLRVRQDAAGDADR